MVNTVTDDAPNLDALLEAAGLKPQHRKNIYTCDTCRHHIVTRDVDDGVTPFMVGCVAPGCNGMMRSSMYNVFDGSMKASHEFYKPAAIVMLSDIEKEYVANGNLLFRRIDRTAEAAALRMAENRAKQ